MTELGEEIFSLVRIASVTGNEKQIADVLEMRLRGGPAARAHKLIRLQDSLLLLPNEIARSTGNTKRVGAPIRPFVVLAGHLDTVPQGEASEPSLGDGKVVGRGAADMKAGVAVMLALAEDLPAEDGFASRAYVFYTGEEGSAKGNALQEILRDESWLQTADLAIVLEPTRGDLELGCNGSIHLAVTFRGQACHSARPWMGSHPLSAALPWLSEMLRYPIRAVEIHGAVFREVVSVTTLRAGDARNVIPGSLEVNLNLRYAPDRPPDQAEKLALSLCPEGVEFELLDHSPACPVDLGSPLYRYLCESTDLPRRAKQGWTDVARFSAHGVPALNWGPGNPELAHTKDEYVDIDSAELCLERMKQFFLGPGPA